VFGSDICRGPREDAEGEDLARFLSMVRDLASPYDGAPAVFSDDELGLFLAGNAIRLFDLKELS
jgi:hypothetical protein